MKYQPGSAHSVSRLQSSSDRRADQVTSTSVLTLLRITTSWRGIARRHWLLNQMLSLPDVILTVSDWGETSHVHAGVRIVRSSRTNVTGLPATVFFAVGVTAMSRSVQVALGLREHRSTVPVALALLVLLRLPVALRLGRGLGGVGIRRHGLVRLRHHLRGPVRIAG